MDNFEYINGGRELLDFVQPLWEKLKKHHEDSSQYFSEKHKKNSFEIRKRKFTDDKSTLVNIDLIKDCGKNMYIGYCISTLDKNSTGEIDSLYVEKEYRKHGFGHVLIKRGLEWLDSNKAETKIIAVAEGNESVLNFYEHYGFYKRRIILEQIR